MRPSKKLFKTLSFLVVLSLAACGKKDETPAVSPTPSPNSGAQPTIAREPSPTPPAEPPQQARARAAFEGTWVSCNSSAYASGRPWGFHSAGARFTIDGNRFTNVFTYYDSEFCGTRARYSVTVQGTWTAVENEVDVDYYRRLYRPTRQPHSAINMEVASVSVVIHPDDDYRLPSTTLAWANHERDCGFSDWQVGVPKAITEYHRESRLIGGSFLARFIGSTLHTSFGLSQNSRNEWRLHQGSLWVSRDLDGRSAATRLLPAAPYLYFETPGFVIPPLLVDD